MEYPIQTYEPNNLGDTMYGTRNAKNYQCQGETLYNNVIKYSPLLRKPQEKYMVVEKMFSI